jgi:hypothetical protein
MARRGGFVTSLPRKRNAGRHHRKARCIRGVAIAERDPSLRGAADSAEMGCAVRAASAADRAVETARVYPMMAPDARFP